MFNFVVCGCCTLQADNLQNQLDRKMEEFKVKEEDRDAQKKQLTSVVESLLRKVQGSCPGPRALQDGEILGEYASEVKSKLRGLRFADLLLFLLVHLCGLYACTPCAGCAAGSERLQGKIDERFPRTRQDRERQNWPCEYV